MSKVELIFHPVRMRLMSQLSGKQMTPRQLAELMPDVAQATLYRQIKRLWEGELIEVVDEQVVNGATERTYTARMDKTQLTGADLAEIDSDTHIQYFTIFTALLLNSFSRYIQQADPNTIEVDGLNYNTTGIYLSHEEREALKAKIGKLLGEAVHYAPSPERHRYTIATIMIPDEEKA